MSKRRHYTGSIETLVNEISNFDWNVEKFNQLLKNLVNKPLSGADIEKIKEQMPQKYGKQLDEVPHDNAYKVLNFLNYLQTHELSLQRSAVLQPVVDKIIQLAA